MFSPTYHSFGLDISDLSLKLVEVHRHLRSLRLTAWHTLDIPAGIIEHGQIKNMTVAVSAVRDLVHRAHGKLSTRYVTACLPETKSFIKLIRIPAALLSQVSSRDALDTIVREQLTHHIPIPLDEARVDWQFVSSPHRDSDVEVLVGAVPKTIASEYATLLRTAGLIPVALEIEAQSIVRALFPAASVSEAPRLPFLTAHKKGRRLMMPKLPFSLTRRIAKPALRQEFPAAIVIDSGATRTSLILWYDGIITFTTSHPLSGAMLTKEISDKLKLTMDEAERTKKICGVDPKKYKGAVTKILDKAISELAEGVIEMSSFYLSHFPNAKPIDRVIICGGNAHLANIDTQLSAKTGIPCAIANPLLHLDESVKGIPPELRLSFTTAIGLALRGLV